MAAIFKNALNRLKITIIGFLNDFIDFPTN